MTRPTSMNAIYYLGIWYLDCFGLCYFCYLV